MHRWRVAVVIAAALGVLTAGVGNGAAQQVVAVSITGTVPGSAFGSCNGEPPRVAQPPQFVLTRTGDTTGALEIAISWGGEIASETTVSPTVAEFAAGSATTTITPLFASVPTVGTLTLTVEEGPGYEPGDPASANGDVVIAAVACVQAPLLPSPPVSAEPSLTG